MHTRHHAPTAACPRNDSSVSQATALRGRRVMEQMSGEGTRVRDVSCTLIPGEEVVFSVYEGPSAAAVRQLNERADIPISRIVEAVSVTRRWSRDTPKVSLRQRPGRKQ